MYGTIAIYTLIATIVLAIIHMAVTRRRPLPVGRRWGLFEVMIYLAFLIVTGVLGGTAIIAMVQHNVMHGWFLWLHLSAAGAFVVLLAVLAIMWGEAARFRPAPAGSDPAAAAPCPPQRFTTLGKAMYWLVLASGFVAMLTILVNMWAVLGTQGQDRTISIHRYAGLVLLAAAVLHLYSLSLSRLGRK